MCYCLPRIRVSGGHLLLLAKRAVCLSFHRGTRTYAHISGVLAQRGRGRGGKLAGDAIECISVQASKEALATDARKGPLSYALRSCWPTRVTCKTRDRGASSSGGAPHSMVQCGTHRLRAGLLVYTSARPPALRVLCLVSRGNLALHIAIQKEAPVEVVKDVERWAVERADEIYGFVSWRGVPFVAARQRKLLRRQQWLRHTSAHLVGTLQIC